MLGLNRKKGERSCSLPLGMALAIPHPFLRFLGYAPAGAGKEFESEFSATEFCSAYSKAVNALINKGELSRVGNQN